MSLLEEKNKTVLRRWVDEMYVKGRFELMPDLAGPMYIRHEKTGTFTVNVEDYWKVLKDRYGGSEKAQISEHRYQLFAEGDMVCVFGSYKGYRKGGDDNDVYNSVQVFRLSDGKIVETWFPGFAKNVEW